MTDRERWIIYPLLFLALGAALRDKLAKQTSAKLIVCEQIYMTDAEGRPTALLSGEGLRFDVAGNLGNGLIRANVIDAQGLFERGKPVATRQPARGLQIPLEQLQKWLPQFNLQPAPGKTVPPADEQPDGAPAGGPELQAPAVEPPGEA